jgi:hypothetical protein
LTRCFGLLRVDWPRHRTGGSDMGFVRPHGSIGCQRKQMVLDTVGTTVETTVESQLSMVGNRGICERRHEAVRAVPPRVTMRLRAAYQTRGQFLLCERVLSKAGGSGLLTYEDGGFGAGGSFAFGSRSAISLAVRLRFFPFSFSIPRRVLSN